MADEDHSLASPPRLGIGAVGVVFGLLALVGTAVAGTLAWRNQIDTVSTSRAMAELQTRWTIAQRDLASTSAALEAATTELEALRDSQGTQVEADRRTEAELVELRDQVARLERELAVLRRQLDEAPAAAPPPEREAAAPAREEAPRLVPEPEVADEDAPVATMSPLVASDDGPLPAVLFPASPEDPPSAWLLPEPGPPAATLAPPAVSP